MPLKDLKTDLKSLKYGKDRLKEGSSEQPYVTKDINDAKPSAPGLTAANKDFLLRGGTAAATSAVDDGVRLVKYFKDLNFTFISIVLFFIYWLTSFLLGFLSTL